MSKARVDLPEPDGPQITTSSSRGMSRLMFLRLCWRAFSIWMQGLYPCVCRVLSGFGVMFIVSI